MAIPVAIAAVVGLIARKGSQEAIKKFGKEAVKQAQKYTTRKKTKLKKSNAETMKKLEQLKIEEKAAETILKRKIEKEGVGSLLKPKVTKTQANRNRRDAAQEGSMKDFQKEMAQQKSEAARQGRLAEQQSRTADKERLRYIEGLGEFDPIEEVPLKFAEGGKVNKGIEALRKEAPEVVARMGYEEGGDVDSQMDMMMSDEPEMMPDEPEMMPDEEMEDEYLDFIVSKALDEDETEMLMDTLDSNPELSIIFDKLMDTATEFSGAGPVDGPGSEVSDSIPARLSDGEFVITAKAADEIGSDTLQDMMDGAEIASDNRQQLAMGGEIDKEQVDQFGKPLDEDITEDEIKKDMMSVNPRLQ